MAQTTYRSKQSVNTVNGYRVACERISELWAHMFNFFRRSNVRFVSMRVLADDRIELVVSNPIPAEQHDHLGLEPAP